MTATTSNKHSLPTVKLEISNMAWVHMSSLLAIVLTANLNEAECFSYNEAW